MRVETERISMVATRTAPRFARRMTTNILTQWRSSADVETVELIVSELVTNVVDALGDSADAAPWEVSSQHYISLYLCETNGTLHVSVRDNLPGSPKRKGLVDADAEGGRGLFLVEMMSKAWGHYRDPCGGKVVWCQLDTARQEETPTTERRCTHKGLPRRRSVARSASVSPDHHDEVMLQRVLDGLLDL